MPLPFAPLLNDAVVNLPLAAYTTAGSPIVFDTSRWVYGALDINLTAFTGGTTPTIQFGLDRLGADGVWYNSYASSVLNSATALCIDFGPGFATVGSAIHHVFTTQGRLTWAITGAPTSVTFSMSMIGR